MTNKQSFKTISLLVIVSFFTRDVAWASTWNSPTDEEKNKPSGFTTKALEQRQDLTQKRVQVLNQKPVPVAPEALHPTVPLPSPMPPASEKLTAINNEIAYSMTQDNAKPLEIDFHHFQDGVLKSTESFNAEGVRDAIASIAPTSEQLYETVSKEAVKESETFFEGEGKALRATHILSGINRESDRPGVVSLLKYGEKADSTDVKEIRNFNASTLLEDFANPKSLEKLTEDKLISVAKLAPMGSDLKIVEIDDKAKDLKTTFKYEGDDLKSSETRNRENKVISKATYVKGGDGEFREKTSEDMLTGIKTENTFEDHDAREDRRDAREDKRDVREDKRDAKRDGGKLDKAEDRRDAREDKRDEREDRREDRRDDRNTHIVKSERRNAKDVLISVCEFKRGKSGEDIPTQRVNALTDVIEKFSEKEDGSLEVKTFGPEIKGKREHLKTEEFKRDHEDQLCLTKSVDEIADQVKTFKYDDAGQLEEAKTVAEKTGEVVATEKFEDGPDGIARVAEAEVQKDGETHVMDFKYDDKGQMDAIDTVIMDGGKAVGEIHQDVVQGPDGSDLIAASTETRGAEVEKTVFTFDDNGQVADVSTVTSLIDSKRDEIADRISTAVDSAIANLPDQPSQEKMDEIATKIRTAVANAMPDISRDAATDALKKAITVIENRIDIAEGRGHDKVVEVLTKVLDNLKSRLVTTEPVPPTPTTPASVKLDPDTMPSDPAPTPDPVSILAEPAPIADSVVKPLPAVIAEPIKQPITEPGPVVSEPASADLIVEALPIQDVYQLPSLNEIFDLVASSKYSMVSDAITANDVKVVWAGDEAFTGEAAGSAAYFDATQNVIMFNTKFSGESAEALATILIHEGTHLLQNLAGTIQSGSVSDLEFEAFKNQVLAWGDLKATGVESSSLTGDLDNLLKAFQSGGDEALRAAVNSRYADVQAKPTERLYFITLPTGQPALQSISTSGNNTQFTYDENGQLQTANVTTNAAAGMITSTSFETYEIGPDGQARIATRTTNNGNPNDPSSVTVQSFEYDSFGNLKSTHSETSTRDANGNMSVTSVSNESYTMSISGNPQLMSRTTVEGNVNDPASVTTQTFSYDAKFGILTTSHSETQTRNASGALAVSSVADETYTMNSRGETQIMSRVTVTGDPNIPATVTNQTFTYDQFANLMGSHIETKTRNAAGDLIISGASDETYRMGPTGSAQLVSRQSITGFYENPAEVSNETFNYDNFGNLTSSTSITQTRDEVGNLRVTTTTNSKYALSATGQAQLFESVTLQGDPNDPSSIVTDQRTYDKYGNITASRSTTQSRDANGGLIVTSVSDSTFGLSPTGQPVLLKTITSDGNPSDPTSVSTVTRSYNKYGNLENAHTETKTRDASGNLIISSAGDETYTVGKTGQPQLVSRTTVTGDFTNPAEVTKQTFNYDFWGNLESAHTQVQTRDANGALAVSSTVDETYTLSITGNPIITSRTTATGNNPNDPAAINKQTFTYDGFANLISSHTEVQTRDQSGAFKITQSSDEKYSLSRTGQPQLVESRTASGDPSDPASVTTDTRIYDKYGNLTSSKSLTATNLGGGNYIATSSSESTFGMSATGQPVLLKTVTVDGNQSDPTSVTTSTRAYDKYSNLVSSHSETQTRNASGQLAVSQVQDEKFTLSITGQPIITERTTVTGANPADPASVNKQTFGYDGWGNLKTSHTETKTRDANGALVISGAADETYTLGPTGQPQILTRKSVTGDFNNPAEVTNESFSYDRFGNLTASTSSTQTRDAAGNLRVTSTTDSKYSLSATGQPQLFESITKQGDPADPSAIVTDKRTYDKYGNITASNSITQTRNSDGALVVTSSSDSKFSLSATGQPILVSTVTKDGNPSDPTSITTVSRTYDRYGNLTAAHNETQTRDANGALVISSAGDETYTLGPTGQPQLVSRQSITGFFENPAEVNQQTFSYDAWGNLQSAHTTVQTRDANGALAVSSTVDEKYTLSITGQPIITERTTVTGNNPNDPAAINKQTFTYDGFANLINSHTEVQTRDQSGAFRVTQVSDEKYSLSRTGQPQLVESITKAGDPSDPASITKDTRSYDKYGNLTSSTSVTSVNMGNGTFLANSMTKSTFTITATGQPQLATSTTYDGNVTTVNGQGIPTDATSVSTTTSAYDKYGNLQGRHTDVQTRNASGQLAISQVSDEKYTLSITGQPIITERTTVGGSNPADPATVDKQTFTYDGWGNLQSAHTVSQTRDDAGKLIVSRVTDEKYTLGPTGQPQIVSREAIIGDITRTGQFFDGEAEHLSETFTYDRFGNLTASSSVTQSRVNGALQVTSSTLSQYSLSATGQPQLSKSVTSSGDPNNPTSVTTETRAYDKYGNIKTADSLTQTRDANGQLSVTSGTTSSFALSATGQPQLMSSVTKQGDMNNPASISTSTRTYDKYGLLTTSTTVDQKKDTAGNMFVYNTVNETYGVSSVGQPQLLTRVTLEGNPNDETSRTTQTFAYDAWANLKSSSSIVLTRDANDQLVQSQSIAETYALSITGQTQIMSRSISNGPAGGPVGSTQNQTFSYGNWGNLSGVTTVATDFSDVGSLTTTTSENYTTSVAGSPQLTLRTTFVGSVNDPSQIEVTQFKYDTFGNMQTSNTEISRVLDANCQSNCLRLTATRSDSYSLSATGQTILTKSVTSNGIPASNIETTNNIYDAFGNLTKSTSETMQMSAATGSFSVIGTREVNFTVSVNGSAQQDNLTSTSGPGSQVTTVAYQYDKYGRQTGTGNVTQQPGATVPTTPIPTPGGTTTTPGTTTPTGTVPAPTATWTPTGNQRIDDIANLMIKIMGTTSATSVDYYSKTGMTLAELENVFYQTSEFTERIAKAGNFSAQINAIYQVKFGRAGTEEEISGWVNSGKTIYEIIYAITNNQTASSTPGTSTVSNMVSWQPTGNVRLDTIASTIENVLGMTATSATVNYWDSTGYSLDTIENLMYLSSDFYDRVKKAGDWSAQISFVYQTKWNRAPTAAELNSLISGGYSMTEIIGKVIGL